MILVINSPNAVRDWVNARLPRQSVGPCTAIGIVGGDGKPLAGVLYHTLDAAGLSVQPHVEMTIASESPSWCQRGVLAALFTYPFHQLKARRVTATIARKNKRARKFVERLGFRLEGTLRKGWSAKGRDRDTIDDACIYGMFPETCRWIAADDADRRAA